MVGIGAPCEVEPKLPADVSEVKAGESLAELRVDWYCSPSQHASAFPSRMRRSVRILLASAAIPFISACGEPTRLPARDEVRSASVTVYALSGTDASRPTALNLYELFPVRATGVFDYEIAFDINAAGEAVIYPLVLVAQSEFGIRRVGLLEVDEAFEDVTSAPRGGYVYDEPVVLSPGEVVVIESEFPCIYPYPRLIFSKLVVDRIDLAQRSVHARVVTDRSCGFRSFLPGIPKN